MIAFAIVVTSVHSARPTASYRALELGASAAGVGLIAAAYAVLSAVAAVPLGRAIDRYAPRRFFLAGGTVLLVGTATSAAAPTVLLLGVGQALIGLGQVAAAISLQTMIATWWHTNRDTGFARVGVAASTGQLLGPLLAGAVLESRWPPVSGTTAAFVAGTLLALAAVSTIRTLDEMPTTSTPAQGSSRSPAPRDPVRRILGRRGMPQALVASITVLTALDLMIAYLPVLGEERAVSPGIIGVFLALRAAAGLASRLNMSRMLALVGRRRLLFGSMLGASAAMIGIGAFPAPWVVGLCVMVVGYTLGVGSPMTMAWVASRAPASGRGTALAVRMTGNRIGQILVPAAVGGLASVLGPAAVFHAVAVTLLTSSTLVRVSPLDERP